MKHVIIMPDLGQTTSEAKIVSWLKKPGDKLAMGEPLLEVETDKATMDVEAYVGGFLRKKLANEGDMVAASNPVAILTDTADEEFDEDVKPEVEVCWARLRRQRRAHLQLPLQSAGLSPLCLQHACWQSSLELNFQQCAAPARKG